MPRDKADPAARTIGPYKMTEHLGSGGMGEVYVAQDSRLGRKVAIKLLPSHYARSEERVRRLNQEARAAGALNHPNILTVYDVGIHEGSPYIVSELLEGQTLRLRLAENPLPLRKAMDFACQIARGLSAAHDKGIVHRDLKPENLFLTKDGRVKILDFGLAKLEEPNVGANIDTGAPTTPLMTEPGVILGTVGYMSPEQVRGRQTDHRSDIFSFGAVLYEMLTGRRAFHKESAAETMNAIVNEDPPEWAETNRDLSPGLERVVRRCLEKNPDERFRSAHDLAFALDAIMSSSVGSSGGSSGQTSAGAATGRLKSRERRWKMASIVLLVVGSVAMGILYSRRPQTQASHAVQFLVSPTEPQTFAGGVISPDGRRLAINVWDTSGMSMLAVRGLDSLELRMLPGTETAGSTTGFWSPDSQFIGFFSGGKLKKVEAAGGPPQTICDARNGFGGAWNKDGVIVFAPEETGGLYRVSATGGIPTPVTTLDENRQETSHRWPAFLPDGKHFLYLAQSSKDENSGIYVGTLESKSTKRLVDTNLAGAYASPGFLLFTRERTLMARPFDADKLELTGDAFPLTEDLNRSLVLGQASFSVTGDVLTYMRFAEQRGRLAWFDRTGKPEGAIGSSGRYINLSLSRDGRKVAAARVDAQTGTRDLWLFDISRATLVRFTFNPEDDWLPVWSPDGGRIAFASDQDGPGNLYQKPSSGAASDEQILKTNERKWPTDWSSDGRYIVYTSSSSKTRLDLWILPMEGERTAFPYIQTQFNEDNAKFSPDGKFIAYSSDESGRYEVYVQTFPSTGSKWQISAGGGVQPRWRRDGKELFYISPERKVIAVDIKADNQIFDAGATKTLFQTRLPDYPGPRNYYDVSGDGQHFLMNSILNELNATPINVVINWTADLKKN